MSAACPRRSCRLCRRPTSALRPDAVQPAQLTTQVKALTATQIAGLNATDVSEMSNVQLQALTTAQVSALTSTNSAALADPAGCRPLGDPAWPPHDRCPGTPSRPLSWLRWMQRRFRPSRRARSQRSTQTDLDEFSATQVAALSTAQVKAITTTVHRRDLGGRHQRLRHDAALAARHHAARPAVDHQPVGADLDAARRLHVHAGRQLRRRPAGSLPPWHRLRAG